MKGYRQTDREVLVNRPDIIIKNKKDKIRLLIDVAVSSDRNVIQMETEKKLKYKNQRTEIQRMQNVKCFVIPVIIGAMGIGTKGLKYSKSSFIRQLIYQQGRSSGIFP
jgi:hypothetical protein